MGCGAAPNPTAAAPTRLLLHICIFTLLITSTLVATIPVSCASSVDEEIATTPVAATGLCLSNQSSALLRFKHSFQDFLYPGMLSSWRDNGSDCCHWEGITCDDLTGFVVTLQIPSVTQTDYFVDSISSIHSSLFDLERLQHLNLSRNHFNGTIPKRLGELTHLTHLDLSWCHFSGQVPVELSQMTRLVSLNLSYNYGQLQLQEPNFTMLVKGLPQLQHLQLDEVSMSGRDVSSALSSPSLQKLQLLSLSNCNISGPLDDTLHFYLQSLSNLYLEGNNLQRIPKFLGNLTSLNELHLSDCGLQGKFPQSVFLLPKLETLYLSHNEESAVALPTKNLTWSVGIRDLDLSSIKELSLDVMMPSNHPPQAQIDHVESNGTGRCILPSCSSNRISFRNLSSDNPPGTVLEGLCSFTNLTSLRISNSSLNGTIPTCLFSLSSLEWLDLSKNSLNGIDLTCLLSSSSLLQVDLSNNLIKGSIPLSLFTLPSLRSLNLGYNRLNGSLPVLCYPNSNLKIISLMNNQLGGNISSFMEKLPTLEEAHLSSNYFDGIINISLLLSLKGLKELDASNNKGLRVESCHSNGTDAYGISINPSQLRSVNLSSCNIQNFPRFICQLQGLEELDLSYNNIEGKIPSCLWSINAGLDYLALALDHNKLDGFEEPINVTRSIGTLRVSELKTSSNRINGPIPSFLCNFIGSSFTLLDMSNNALAGAIPDCLYKMTVVKLRRNKLQGQLPSRIGNLEVLDLNGNFLTGKIPKSLSNCTSLQALDLGNNELDDTFPAWLAQLDRLKVLVLKSSRLYGPISTSSSMQAFPALTILDISDNRFSGILPHEFFEGFKAMIHKGSMNEDRLAIYLSDLEHVLIHFPGEVEVTIKGKIHLIKEIQWASNFIDLSNNKFTGEIPDELGMLKYLHGLNVSYNHLQGPIPKSLGNLLTLEQLDFSQNHLSGVIPLELVALTFLSVLNLSYNDLEGSIPQGNQFNTFDSSSFEGNPKLCGKQVQKTCFDGDGQNAPKSDIVDEGNEGEEGWKYGSLGIGFTAGLMTMTLPLLFVKKVADWYWAQTDGMLDFILLQIYAFLNIGRDRWQGKFPNTLSY